VADATSHARHDRFAIAASIGGGPRPATLGTCPACGALHRDLLAIRTALRHAWTPGRPRKLLLTAADAARLRRGPWRRLVEAIGSPADIVTRPLAASLTALGLAGLLLTAVPFGAPAGSGAVSIEATPFAIDIGAASPAPADGREAAPPVPISASGIPSIAALSGGLLGAGTGLFVARRVAGRRAVR
jgi:hypothetical protein